MLFDKKKNPSAAGSPNQTVDKYLKIYGSLAKAKTSRRGSRDEEPIVSTNTRGSRSVNARNARERDVKANGNKYDRGDRSNRERGRRLGEGQLNSRHRGLDPTMYSQNQRAQRNHSFRIREEGPTKSSRSRHSEQRYKGNKEETNSNALRRSRRTNETRAKRKGRRVQPSGEHLDDEFNAGSLEFDPRASNGRGARKGSGSLIESLKFSIGGIEQNPVPRRDSVAAPTRILSFSKLYVTDPMSDVEDDSSTEMESDDDYSKERETFNEICSTRRPFNSTTYYR